MLIVSLRKSRRLFTKFNRVALHPIAPSRGRSMLAVSRRLAEGNGRRCKLDRSCGVSGRDEDYRTGALADAVGEAAGAWWLWWLLPLLGTLRLVVDATF